MEGQESVVTDYILKVSKNTLPKTEQEKWIWPLTVCVFLSADSGSGDLCRCNGWGLYDQRYLRRTKEACHNRYVQPAFTE